LDTSPQPSAQAIDRYPKPQMKELVAKKYKVKNPFFENANVKITLI